MIHTQTIQVPADDIAKVNEILQRGEFVDEVSRDEVFCFQSLSFEDGIEVDIKVCNGDPPFVDAVLFKDGHEISVVQPDGDTLDGEYHFCPNGCNEDEYLVIIETE